MGTPVNNSIFSATAAAAVVLVTAACAMDGAINPTSSLCSTPRKHCINVYLLRNNIKVDVDPLYVYGTDNEIYWQLDPVSANGYTFTANGIVFPSGALSEFPGCRPIQGGTVFFCPDRNTKPG